MRGHQAYGTFRSNVVHITSLDKNADKQRDGGIYGGIEGKTNMTILSFYCIDVKI